MFIAACGDIFRHAAVGCLLLCASLMFPGELRAQEHKPLAEDIKALAKRVTPEAAKNVDVQAAVQGLLKQFLQDEQTFGAVALEADDFLKRKKDNLNNPHMVVDALASVLGSTQLLIKRFDKEKLGSNFDELKKQLGAAGNSISKSEAHLDQATAAIAQMQRVIETIDAKKMAPVSEDDPFAKKAAALRTKLVSVMPGEFRINVVGAWYGDIRNIRRSVGSLRKRPFEDGFRACSATRPVRTSCQGHRECAYPIDAADNGGTAGNVTGAQLCTYDPTPFAPERVKGMLIKYQCVPAFENFWATAPADAPDEYKNKNAPVLDVWLRNTSTSAKVEFSCQPKQPS